MMCWVNSPPHPVLPSSTLCHHDRESGIDGMRHTDYIACAAAIAMIKVEVYWHVCMYMNNSRRMIMVYTTSSHKIWMKSCIKGNCKYKLGKMLDFSGICWKILIKVMTGIEDFAWLCCAVHIALKDGWYQCNQWHSLYYLLHIFQEVYRHIHLLNIIWHLSNGICPLLKS